MKTLSLISTTFTTKSIVYCEEPKKLTENEWKELINSNLAIKIYSKILDDTLWIVSNKNCLNKVTDRAPVYLIKEVRLIENEDAEFLQKIHLVKKTFDGEIVEDWEIDDIPSPMPPPIGDEKDVVKEKLAQLRKTIKPKQKEIYNEQHQTQLFKNG